MAETVTNLNKWKQPAKWSFPQSSRGNLYGKKYDRYQTYDVRKSMGPQFLSTKKTEPDFKIGTETRDGRLKAGMFKSAMSQPPLQVRIPHPSF